MIGGLLNQKRQHYHWWLGSTAASSQAKALLGIVPQEPALYPQLSAAANLRFWGTMQGLQRSELNKAVAEALAVVGLTERARERV